MSDVESDTVLDFPCDIPIKIFGRNEMRFRYVVTAIIEEHFGELDDADVSERLSREDRYVSLTVTVRAESREQIDALFSRLSAHEAILMVL